MLGLAIAYVVAGWVVAVLYERNSQAQGHRDMSDVAWMLILAWPAFLFAMAAELTVRPFVRKKPKGGA